MARVGSRCNVDERVRADALELRALPRCELAALVLRVGDLERPRAQSLACRGGRARELNSLPVALVLVVEVVEVVVEPVLQRDPVRDARLCDDSRVGRRARAAEDAAGGPLVPAARVERIAGEIEVVVGRLAVEVGGG